jgi:hypothetical protein
VEGDIQFLAFVVGNGFLAQRQQIALFLKVLPASALDQSRTRYRKSGEFGATTYIFGGAIKRFLVQKLQLVALQSHLG